MIRILDDVLVTCQSTATLDAAHQLLRTLTSNKKFSGLVDTTEMLEDVLAGIGFGGLWRSSTFHAPNEQERKCTILTDRLIEVISWTPLICEMIANICSSSLLESTNSHGL